MAELYDRAAAERQVREAASLTVEAWSIDSWLTTPAPAFDGKSAMDLLDEGPAGRDRVLALLDAIASGAFL